MVLLYTAPFLRVYLHEAEAVLESEWLDNAQGEPLRRALQEMLRLALRHQVRGWVANQRQMRIIRTADQEWINQTWFPAFSQLPLLRCALIVSEDALNRMGIRSVLQHATATRAFPMEFFSDVLAARRWVVYGAQARN